MCLVLWLVVTSTVLSSGTSDHGGEDDQAEECLFDQESGEAVLGIDFPLYSTPATIAGTYGAVHFDLICLCVLKILND